MNSTTSQSHTFSLLHDKRWFQLCLLTAALLFLLWFRFPTITTGLPYFSQEDEAHHFNRVVRMVQSGKWDPEYFHKPSLHFYLRMPVVAASFLWNVREGHIRKIEEISTKDPYGIAGYSFTASHSGIVKWNRAFSVLLIMLSLWLTYLLAFELTGSFFLSLGALLVAGVSPELLRYSGTIGVDVVMTFFCMLTTYLSVRYKKGDSLLSLAVIGVCAGLAVSSKYNALPIMGLPFALCILHKRFDAATLATSLFTPVLGFFVASPYILSSLPLFLNQFAYEIWHYGIAGHVGHTAEPGMQQALFYASWLRGDGLGTLGAILAALGVLGTLKNPSVKVWSVLWFPFLFCLLMIFQRANFTRNMIAVLPFAACFATYGLSLLLSFVSKTSILRPAIVGVALLFLIGEPLVRSLEIRHALATHVDSRDELTRWVNAGNLKGETALSGRLWASRDLVNVPSLTRYEPSKNSSLDLYLKGYTNIITGPKGLKNNENLFDAYTSTLKEFPGETKPQRIVRNPYITVRTFLDKPSLREEAFDYALDHPEYNLELQVGYQRRSLYKPFTCLTYSGATEQEEGHCWLSSRINTLTISNVTDLNAYKDSVKTLPLAFEIMTPWQGQEVTFLLDDWEETFELTGAAPGSWQKFTLGFPLRKLLDSDKILVTVKRVSSPSSHGESRDTRRLGVALRNVHVPL